MAARNSCTPDPQTRTQPQVSFPYSFSYSFLHLEILPSLSLGIYELEANCPPSPTALPGPLYVFSLLCHYI